MAAADPEVSDDGEPVYEVRCDADGKNCKVDMDTFVGWRMYTSNCLACHGQDGKGSTIAPNLMDRLNAHVDYPRFTDVVTNGFTGTMGVMPSFKNSQNVIDRIPSIYKYLRARADGALAGGRPERLP
ncbi:MAG: c-type cytochrome [Gammaproteobacteria bacterium]